MRDHQHGAVLVRVEGHGLCFGDFQRRAVRVVRGGGEGGCAGGEAVGGEAVEG